MEEIDISQLRANFSALLKRVQESRQPIRITQDGKPLADIVPVSDAPLQTRSEWIGSMRDSVQILGDIVSPANEESECES